MKTLYLLIFLTLIGYHSLMAQQDAYHWRLGAYSGVMSYHGDLNSRFMASGKAVNSFSMLSYGVSLEKSISKSWSGKLLYTNGQFYANDRAIHWDGSADSDRSNYGRSLNAQTDIQDLSMIFTYYFDNDYLFARRAFVSPYFTVGLGLTNFEVYGDLYDASGQRYHYWSDNSIRTEAETSTSAGNATIVQQDGKYETNLSQLNTERDYNTSVFNIPFGAGIKFRISSRVNLNLDVTARYTFTDYLEDVSSDYRTEYANDLQAYAANPTNRTAEGRGDSDRNDFYTFASVSLHFNFGKKSEKFIAPKIYPSSSYVAPQLRRSEKNGAESQVNDTLSVAPAPLSNRTKFSGFDFFNPIPEAYDSMSLFSTSGINTYGPTYRQLDFPKPFPSEYAYAIPDDNFDLQNDTIRQLEYEVKKIKLQNELYELRRDSPDPRIKEKFMQDSTRQSFLPVDEQAPVNTTPTYTTSDSSASNNLDTPTPRLSASPDSVQLNKVQREIDELQQMLSDKAPIQNQRPEDIATIQQLQRRVEMLSAELEYRLNPTQPIQNARTPSVVVLPQNSANNDIRHVERELQALSNEMIATRNAQTTEDSATQRSLASAMKTEEALKAKLVALDSQSQATGIRNDSLRQARINAERDSLENEIKQLQQTLSTLKSERPDTVIQEVIGFPELPKTALFFDVNSSTLSEDDKRRIKKVAQILLDYPKMQVTLQGYTDKTGRADYNMLLSQKRARAVQQELELSGVTSNRIITESNGVDNDLKNKASQYGRRVEILFSFEK